ncbi:DUF2570 domain-containing protein [Sodalis-like symbiont of Philaenus spumarius]|nr:DUF2570 domain-containing protein [Sodalis-like symbiont of Philaenus spumarius]BAN97865.1 hypothetical protein E05_30990 [Plautia stali symbiont]
MTGSLKVVFTLCLLASLLGAGGWLWQRERLRETALCTLRQERDAAWQALAEQRQTQQVFHTLEQTVEHEKQQQRGESEKGRQQVRQRLSRLNCAREPVPGPVADRVRRDARESGDVAAGAAP